MKLLDFMRRKKNAQFGLGELLCYSPLSLLDNVPPPALPDDSLEGKQLWKHELNSVTGVSGKRDPLGLEDKRGAGAAPPLAFCPPQIRDNVGCLTQPLAQT